VGNVLWFLVVKRLGLTNELRASEDKLQGPPVVRESVPNVAGGVQNATGYGHEANYEIECCLEAFSAAAGRVLIARENSRRKAA
jgi:hypothetical protein